MLRATGHARMVMVRIYPTCCPLVRFSHRRCCEDAARDGPCAHGKVRIKDMTKLIVVIVLARALNGHAFRRNSWLAHSYAPVSACARFHLLRSVNP